MIDRVFRRIEIRRKIEVKKFCTLFSRGQNPKPRRSSPMPSNKEPRNVKRKRLDRTENKVEENSMKEMEMYARKLLINGMMVNGTRKEPMNGMVEMENDGLSKSMNGN